MQRLLGEFKMMLCRLARRRMSTTELLELIKSTLHLQDINVLNWMRRRWCTEFRMREHLIP